MKFHAFMVRKNGAIHICPPGVVDSSFCGRTPTSRQDVEEIEINKENLGYLCIACYRDIVPQLVAGGVISASEIQS
jgi:hypothetical protein